MKNFKSLMILTCFSLSAFAESSLTSTCPLETKRTLTCFSAEDQQIDFCKRKTGAYQIRINGEIYAQQARRSHFDGLMRYQGKSSENVRFIVEIDPKKKNGSLTEVNRFEMPMGEPLKFKKCL